MNFPITDHLFKELEDRGWCMSHDFFSSTICDELEKKLKKKLSTGEMGLAKVGAESSLQLNQTIRSSSICWVNDWQEVPALGLVEKFFNELMSGLNSHFLLSLKRFETQFAYYESGGFYKKHLDQLVDSRHRQITCLLYLNDCDQGGELIIYGRDDRNKIEAKITPRRGLFLCFFSSQIFHEVLECKSPRYSMTTWMRDDVPFLNY